MTQAFNLSQLANNVNTSGLLNAAAGLYNQTPVANGGTGRSSVTSGRLVVGAGTSAMTELAGAATNDVVTWNGSAWSSAAPQGGALQTFTVAVTPGTWTKPATVKGIKVTVVGGGGNGGTASAGGNTSQQTAAGGGGGGGAAIRLYPAPSLPGPQPYTVGAAGGTSSFGVAPLTVVSATGGSSGTSSATPPSGHGAGGAGGAGSSGNANMDGSDGTPGSAPGPIGTQMGGNGGSSILGGSGRGGSYQNAGPNGQNGNPGGKYGGGGGGGTRGSGPTANPGNSPGGAGAAGVVIIEEFY